MCGNVESTSMIGDALEWDVDRGNSKNGVTMVKNRISVRMRGGWFANVYVQMNLRDGAQRPGLRMEN